MLKDIFISLLLVACLHVTSNEGRYTKTNKKPIILVPGFGGSQLFASLKNVRNLPNPLCRRNYHRYIQIWLRVDFLFPYAVDCFVHYMQLNYDPISKATMDTNGVNVITKDWGNTRTIESVNKLGTADYYGELVDHLVKNYGYVRNISIRGVPYDFRRTPRENVDVIRKMKSLVEETYELNNQMRVVFVGHSYGCVYTLHFLNQQTSEWKEKYVDSFVSTSGPLGGSAVTIKAVSSGNNFNIGIVKPEIFGKLSRSWPSTYLFLPREEVWKSKEVLAMTNERNYTIEDFKNFFHDSNNAVGYELYQNALSAVDLSRAPDVKVYCRYSQDQPTPLTFDWRNKNFPSEEPNISMGPGDGTVNKRSLDVCSGWSKKQKEAVDVKLFHGVDHKEIIKSDKYFDDIVDIATN